MTSQEFTASGTQEKVQKFGRFLSGMVMPNIGAFIAWGLITALFIPTGWMPNEYLSNLVGPMITFLLPTAHRLYRRARSQRSQRRRPSGQLPRWA